MSSTSSRDRWRIALAILALYALAIGYVAQADRPVPIAPRTFHCGVVESCSVIRLGVEVDRE